MGFLNFIIIQYLKLQLINNADGSVFIDNVGSYNTSTGVITISGQNITAINGDAIKITATPKDPNTIKPLRNYILKNAKLIFPFVFLDYHL